MVKRATKYETVMAFLRDHTNGEDKRTIWGDISSLADKAGMSVTRFRTAIRQLERKGFIEPLRAAESGRIRFSGIRLLKLPSDLPSTKPAQARAIVATAKLARVSATAAAALKPTAATLPPTPTLDEIDAALAQASTVGSIITPPLVEEALALRRWTREHVA
jgi:MarR-like DNA-binding transcriptional regulator SgrR of sgrS sRNA